MCSDGAWDFLTIEEIAEEIIDYRGKSPKKSDAGVPLITAKIVKNGRIDVPTEFVPESDYAEWMRRGIPKSGDVVITTEAPLGEIAQLGPGKVALAQRLIVLRANPELMANRFLKFALEFSDVQQQLRARATGTTVLGIKQSELRKVKIPVPSLHEQRRIAHILGTLDDKIELNRRMSRILEAIARAIFKSWFVDFDPVHAKAEGREPVGMDPETAAHFPDGFQDSPLGKIPEGWEVCTIGNLGDVVCGKTPPTAQPENYGIGIPFITIPDMRDSVFITKTSRELTEFGAATQPKKLLPANSICVSCIATPGLVSLTSVPSHTNQQINSIVCRNGVSQYWCYLQLRSMSCDIVAGGAGGSATLNLNKRQFSALRIPLPPSRIQDALHEVLHPVFASILASAGEAGSLERIRDTLLPRLLSGELPEEALL